jgi:hypothetical protein
LPARDQSVDRWFSLTPEERGLVAIFAQSLGLNPSSVPLNAKVSRHGWLGRTWLVEQFANRPPVLRGDGLRAKRELVVCRQRHRLDPATRAALRKFGWLRPTDRGGDR